MDPPRGAVRTPPPVAPEPRLTPNSVAAAKSRSPYHSWLPIAGLVVLYVALATAYNVSVPLYEAPDEHSHVAYVDALQRTGKVPHITEVTYEAAGPPLYHATGAAALKLLGLSPPGITLPRNEDSLGSPNVFLHTPGENDLPFRGPVLSIHLVRAISTLFGAGTVAFVFLIATWLFPTRALLALAAGANTALLPQFAFVGGAVMNDTSVAFFSAGAVYASLRFMEFGSQKWLLLAAGSLALGFLCEASMIVAAVACGLAVLLSPLSWHGRSIAGATLVAAPVLVAGWYYVGNILEYGEAFPGDAVHAVTPLGSGLSLTHPQFRGFFQSTLDRSYWYLGGWLNVPVVGSMYQLLDVLTGMALGGTILVATRGHLSSFQRRGLVLLATLIVLAIVGVIWVSTRISFEPQGRYLFVAQPAIALLFALGIGALFQRDVQRDSLAVVLLPVILLGLNLGILMLTLPGAY